MANFEIIYIFELFCIVAENNAHLSVFYDLCILVILVNLKILT